MKKFIKSQLISLNEQYNSNINVNFWRWFGDSKIVDNSANPQIVYHRSNSDFSSFDPKKLGSATDKGIRGMGYYFSTSEIANRGYGSNLYEVYLKIENPFDLLRFDSMEELAEYLEVSPSIFIDDKERFGGRSVKVYSGFEGLLSDSVSDKGYDGIIHGTTHEIVAFYPNQIKSIHNDGTWDWGDNNIYS
jgi:hypothetical protein